MSSPQDLGYQSAFERPPGNGLGIAGFIVSLVGIFTCGLLAPVGLILSAVGMRKEPRGLAVAGLVMGILGLLEAAAVVVFFVLAVQSASRGIAALGPHFTTITAIPAAGMRIKMYSDKHGAALPADVDGNTEIAAMRDGWGHPLRYHQVNATEFEIRSGGPDGLFDTADDLNESLNTAAWPPATTSPE
jgi:hypothetical protein